MLPLSQALEQMLNQLPSPTGMEVLPIHQASQRICAENVISPINVPSFDNSAMDGYAVRAADLSPDAPTELSVAGRTLAGDAPATLPAGHAQRIMTGAPMPAGADTVIMQERVQVIETGEPAQARIIIPPGQHAGQNIRRRGEDLQQGAIALPAGSALSAIALGVAASLGHTTVDVFRPLRVGVFSTGNELVQPGQTLAPGQIHDSNRPTLLALVAEQGWQPVDLGSLPDDPARLGDALQRAAPQVDVLLTTGGAAGGDADLLQPVLSATPNSEAMAWKLRLRPGRPLVVGRVGQTPLFGLPGNPISAYVGLDILLKSALWQLCGTDETQIPQPLRFEAVLSAPVKKAPGRMDIQRALITQAEDGSWQAAPCGPQDSHRVLGISQANAYLILPLESGPLAAGECVTVQPFLATFL